jgi:hypothetical protein
LKGIAAPVPPVECWINKNLISGARRQHWNGWGREGGENVSVNGILQPNACEN